jgi:[acyl-carrier-protein] S-malonyltransferase
MDIDPKTTAFIFPGQASQRLGMGHALAQIDSHALEIFKHADRILGFTLSKLCWEGPADLLNDTENTQPALVTHSIAVLRALQARHPWLRPACLAGHSLGEYSALVAAEALTFDDALRLVLERGRAMKQAGVLNPGGMIAVLGVEIDDVEKICVTAAQVTGKCVIVANDNCPGQTVISGEQPALDMASELLRSEGARRLVPLNVSVAGHSPLMQPAQSRLESALTTTPIAEPSTPVIGNVLGRPMLSAAAIRQELAVQITERLRWTESMQNMIANGINTVIELGPGNTLSSMMKRIDSNVRAVAIDEPDSFAMLDRQDDHKTKAET